MHDSDAEALIGISAWILARDIRSYQALVAGLPVPLWRLRSDVLEELGINPLGDKSLVMSQELALLIEIYRPYPSTQTKSTDLKRNSPSGSEMTSDRPAAPSSWPSTTSPASNVGRG